MGPAIVIALGVLFLLHELRGGMFDFGNTWPVLLVVIGAIRLASAVAPMDGHISPVTAPSPVPPLPGAPPNPPPGQGF